MASKQTAAVLSARAVRRACDECRQRKLACSKNSDGCDRCKRDSIVCHYSEQKPMGRPRKRQNMPPVQVSASEQNHNAQEPELLSSFVDSLDYTAETFATPYYTADQQFGSSSFDKAFKEPITTALDGPNTWLFSNQTVLHGPPIDYGDIDLGPGESDNIPPLVDSVPQIPPVLPNPPTTDNEGPTSTSTSPCCCLSSIYLSLAALQQFPSDIVTALRNVRRAAAVASRAIWCPQCGSIMLTTTTPLIESFQNIMLLGTLLPVVAHGYKRLLEMVDEETNAAIAANQTKVFNLLDYGGLCGGDVDPADALPCAERDLLFNSVVMPPIQWRTTVRALLRVDIYGHETPSFKHKGLKDIVGEIEYRQKARHELVDAAQAAGTLDPHLLGHGLFKPGKRCGDSDTPACLQMMKIAKNSIDELLIA